MIGLTYSFVLIPLINTIFIFLIPKRRAELFRPLTIFLSLIPLGLCLYIFLNQNLKTSFNVVDKFSWISAYGINLTFGLSGMSFLLITLNCLLVLLSILSLNENHGLSKGFLGSLMLLQASVNGVFLAGDLISLFIFFEALLIPMYFLMGIWGGENRRYATIKFILFTVFGSIFILAGTIYTGVLSYLSSGSFALDFETISSLSFTSSQSKILFLLFTFGFLIKVPIFPLHTWLPDAHVEAPTAGSVILAGVLLKLAGYGFIRFSITMFPDASHYFAPMIYALSIIAIIFTSLIALVQEDMKKLIAYSSVAHMGFVTLGIFTFTIQGIEGAIIQMISHGIVSAALFLCVGVVYDRIHTREIERYGGLVNRMPLYSFSFMIFILASLGLPGTSGFVGEFLVLLSIFSVNTYFAVFATTGVVLAATYSLWLYRKIIFGQLIKDDLKDILDLSSREIIIFVPLILLTLLIGIYPIPVLEIIEPSSQLTLEIINGKMN